MREPPTRYLVVERDSSVVGIASWQVVSEEDEAVVYWFVFSLQGLIPAMSYNSTCLFKEVGSDDN
jgi:hypothetical protein